jgi:asparagine synthetase B (glutamine-hydrolysing)
VPWRGTAPEIRSATSDIDLTDQLAALIQDAVSRSTIADVPVGASRQSV